MYKPGLKNKGEKESGTLIRRKAVSRLILAAPERTCFDIGKEGSQKMGIINVLDPQVANLIAAGEVVDRPASVVKELLENAIDAGAGKVTVEIKRGGTTFIRVSDDGCGMSREDVPVCIKRHATSKIHDEADLDGIMTLGFRGEALAAIGAVSKLRIMTKQRSSAMGTQLTCVGGEIQEIMESGCRDGTTIIVEELFANVPARRKFLKKDVSEAMAVAAVVEKIALSRPDISIKLISDGTVRFDTAGDGNLKSCIYAVLGREFAQKLCEVNGLTGGIEVTGYVGTPENIRANRNYQNFFINGRYVKSRTAMAAIEQAFTSYIPAEKFPVCVLEIKIHPALVDVNVHPTKLEVKFSNEQAVFDAVYSAVRTSLQKNLARPVFQLKTKDEARRESRVISAFVPLKDGKDEVRENRQLSFDKNEAEGGVIPLRHAYPLSGEETLPPHLRFGREKDAGEPPLPYAFDSSIDGRIPLSSANKNDILAETDWAVRSVDVPYNKEEAGSEGKTVSDINRVIGTTDTLGTERSGQAPEPEGKFQGSLQSDGASGDKEVKTPSGVTSKAEKNESKGIYSVSHIPRDSAVSDIGEVPEYRIIGEVFNSYILVETEGVMLMIDKHAAHERILFEDMKKNISSGSSSQILIMPLEVTLSPEEAAAVSEYSDDLRATGFDYCIHEGSNIVSITAIPQALSSEEAETFFVTAAGQLASGTGSLGTAHSIFYEQALYSASCKAAIKAGRVYTGEHVDWICRRVLSDRAIRFCPHGRPVAYELPKNEIEHWFKRK